MDERYFTALKKALSKNGKVSMDRCVILDGWSNSFAREAFNWALTKKLINAKFIDNEEDQYSYYEGTMTSEGFLAFQADTYPKDTPV